VRAEDLPQVDAYRERVGGGRPAGGAVPPPELIAWVRAMRERTLLFRERIPEGLDLERDWAHVPCTTREDVGVRPETLVPIDADLSRLIVYDTSGTTGHAIVVPHHPRAVAQCHALMELALGRHGVSLSFGPDRVACLNLGAQHTHTVVFATTFAVWNEAGFAKVNLHPGMWRGIDDARRFFDDLGPQFLTGDPVGFAELLAWEIPSRPAALVSTALALGSELRARLGARFACPVIDWYSTTETGPVAYGCPRGEGLHVLPPDVFVEVVDEDGRPLPAGESGEIAVTGGRNPYLPLLRYRTGDWGRIDGRPCSCGDPAPRIVDLEGRRPVFFRGAGGAPVNAVDVAHILRLFPVLQHEVVQRADGSCDVALRFLPGSTGRVDGIAERLRELLGPDLPLRVREDEDLGRRTKGGKVQPYRRE
jgi:phenylacetate-CoA ligase